ncbi:unnamed protein product [Calicophoron daubneyi]|uniref:BEN domain-containing protein n=1 Tax=Calicophoron daubneyi TaxID=300641 RepID=A0AAV2TA76_CALDB
MDPISPLQAVTLKPENGYGSAGGTSSSEHPPSGSDHNAASRSQRSPSAGRFSSSVPSSLRSACEQGIQTDVEFVLCTHPDTRTTREVGCGDSHLEELSEVRDLSLTDAQVPVTTDKDPVGITVPESAPSPAPVAIRSRKRKSTPARTWNSEVISNGALSDENIPHEEPSGGQPTNAHDMAPSNDWVEHPPALSIPTKLSKLTSSNQHPAPLVHIDIPSDSPVSVVLDNSSDALSPLDEARDNPEIVGEVQKIETPAMQKDALASVRSDLEFTSITSSVPPLMPAPSISMDSTMVLQTPVTSCMLTNGSDKCLVAGSGNEGGESEEVDFDRIQQIITSDPLITSSRFWSIYQDASEWTRATCALMSALFTSDQMASSTVLGRSSTEPRDRLPVDKVGYIVGAVSRRFGVSAAKIRTRMAQKCKDERRKYRLSAQALNPTAYYSMIA